MKFRVTMKDPDCLANAVDEAVGHELASISGLSDDEREELLESRAGNVHASMRKWFEHGEYLTVEVDTNAKTCVVVPKE